ncbi:hypothetical protein NC651_002224 [Populus alba x Populus x berolinensis]|nr:hypothetical protein NC651_002224 [Populus alba x Populus x berolinensis]
MFAGFNFFITGLHFLIGRVDLQVDLMARLDPKIYFRWDHLNKILSIEIL